LQAVSTSIDALVVGITFIDLTFSLWLAIAIIVLTTFVIVSLALALGKKLGCMFGKYADYVGATILLILSIKSFVQAII
jgi:putative Mn2+ efflux pump MntP